MGIHPDANYMNEHRPNFGVAYFVRYADVGPGDVITFLYKGEMRWAFVLDPNHEEKCHALTLKLTPRQKLIDTVVDGMFDTDVPKTLYYNNVYKVAKDWDSYRTYFVDQMTNVRRLPYYLTPKPELRKTP